MRIVKKEKKAILAAFGENRNRGRKKNSLASCFYENT